MTFSRKRKGPECNNHHDQPSVSTKQVQYGKTKEIQGYHNSWEETWSWLYHDEHTEIDMNELIL